MSNFALTLAVAVLCAVLYRLSVRREPRRLRLGVYLVAVLWLLFGAFVNLVDALLPHHHLSPLVVLAPLPVSVLVLAGFMVADGLAMVRNGARRVRTLLPVVGGLTLAALPVVGLLLARSQVGLLLGLAALAFVVPFYLGVAFVCFIAYAGSYGRLTVRADPAAVVVLGSKLVRGGIPRLLEGRLDQGIDQWQRQVALGHLPLIVPSGGVGPDETCSEGATMADYLIRHGIPTADVVAETTARTTEENLGMSQQLARARGREGHLTVVTSGYHVARTSLLTRRAGLDADVVGSLTAASFAPRVFLREFRTVLTFYPRLHVALGLPAAALAFVLARTL